MLHRETGIMRILLTGAFGNIGKNVLRLLLEADHPVRCFDLETPKNLSIYEAVSRNQRNGRRVEVFWGDVRDPATVEEAVQDTQGIIHLAALIPPMSEKDPEKARAINVQGTGNLIRAAQAVDPNPTFVFTSSVSVYGPKMTAPPPRTIHEPVNPTDNYSSHKVECEQMLQASGLPWTILRVAAVSVSDLDVGLDPILFEIPLDQRIEFVHSKDVARACVNALRADAAQKILHIGGGTGSQMLQRDFLKGILEATGIGMLPESAFRVPRKDSDWYYTDYMDSGEAQALLHYQLHSFEDYLKELTKSLGGKRILARLLGPVIRLHFSAKSPYFRAHWRRRLGLGKATVQGAGARDQESGTPS
jgi:nucleoside-diphosphate-sugar epimerase